MITALWVLVVGICYANGTCVPDLSQDLHKTTYSSEQSCEVAGFLIDYMSNKQLPRTKQAVHKCYAWKDFLEWSESG